MKTTEGPNRALGVYMIFLVLNYSGVLDFLSFLSAIKPGILCVSILLLFWFSDGRFKQDFKQAEIKSIALLIVLSGFSVFYAANTGTLIKLFQTEVIYFAGFILGASVALRTESDLRLVLVFILFFGLIVPLQTIGGGGFGPSMLGDENDVSVAILIMLPFLYYGDRKSVV